MGPNAVPALLEALQDSTKDAAVRGRAAESLGKIGPAAKYALPALTEVIKQNPGKGAKKKGPTPTGDIRLEVVVRWARLPPPATRTPSRPCRASLP